MSDERKERHARYRALRDQVPEPPYQYSTATTRDYWIAEAIHKRYQTVRLYNMDKADGTTYLPPPESALKALDTAIQLGKMRGF